MLVKVKFEQGAVGTPHTHYHTQTTYVASGKFEFTVNGENNRIGWRRCLYRTGCRTWMHLSGSRYINRLLQSYESGFSETVSLSYGFHSLHILKDNPVPHILQHPSGSVALPILPDLYYQPPLPYYHIQHNGLFFILRITPIIPSCRTDMFTHLAVNEHCSCIGTPRTPQINLINVRCGSQLTVLKTYPTSMSFGVEAAVMYELALL